MMNVPFHTPSTHRLLALLLALTPSCTKLARKKAEPQESLPDKPVKEEPVAAQSSEVGLLTVTVKVRDDGLLLEVQNIPPESSLECDLGSEPLSPCHDGALFARPAKEGDYTISVDAVRNGSRVATGKSEPFTVQARPTGSGETPEPNHPLTLVFADPNLKNDMTAPRSQAFTIGFQTKSPPPCATPELKCRYDSLDSPFWTSCDRGASSFTVPKGLMALGRQELAVQARCGDLVGPILSLAWYGVPDGYEELMLYHVTDNQGRHFFEPVRDLDCPSEDRRMECATKKEDDFGLCANANLLQNPPSGLRIRLACKDKKGPVLTMP